MKVINLKKKSSSRIDVRYIQNLGIQAYGEDNLYAETLENIVSASSTGSECVDRFMDFIEGNGFREVAFSEYVVNRKGETVDDIHAMVCRDMALYNGFALHLNYNIYGEIVELQHIPFKGCRLMEEDDNGYVAKIAVHPDWTGKKTRKGKVIKVNPENIDYIDVFNPIKNVVQAQINAAGGIEYYKGQVLWFSMNGKQIYPVSKADRVITEMSTDEGLANVKYRNVRNNFLPAGIVVTKKSESAPENESDQDEAFSDSMTKLLGDTNAAKLMEIKIESSEEAPQFIQMATQNYDKEFTVTDASVVERIYSAYNQEPWYCIRVGKVGFSGDILEDAFEYYNSIVSKQQRSIERVFSGIFKYWYEIANPSMDFSVQPLKYVRNAAVSNNI